MPSPQAGHAHLAERDREVADENHDPDVDSSRGEIGASSRVDVDATIGEDAPLENRLRCLETDDERAKADGAIVVLERLDFAALALTAEACEPMRQANERG